MPRGADADCPNPPAVAPHHPRQDDRLYSDPFVRRSGAGKLTLRSRRAGLATAPCACPSRRLENHDSCAHRNDGARRRSKPSDSKTPKSRKIPAPCYACSKCRRRHVRISPLAQPASLPLRAMARPLRPRAIFVLSRSGGGAGARMVWSAATDAEDWRLVPTVNVTLSKGKLQEGTGSYCGGRMGL